MKKVVLLGDSIRCIGYGPRIAELLGEDYTVWQSEDNCRFVKYTLRCLFEWREDIKDADIIHWNNGLWDTSTGLFDDGGKPFTGEEEYVENMPLLVNDEGGAHNSHILAAIHTLLLPHVVGCGDTLVGIGHQRKVQLVLGAEVLVRLDAVGTHAHNLETHLGQSPFAIP